MHDDFGNKTSENKLEQTPRELELGSVVPVFHSLNTVALEVHLVECHHGYFRSCRSIYADASRCGSRDDAALVNRDIELSHSCCGRLTMKRAKTLSGSELR